ncbi:hypothetical protein BC831DRAFT_492302 [Entophlyctis helioformis]|nr:hypothetical protein BC831DRAFT_492302 [Entophlyctis helioformis]
MPTARPLNPREAAFLHESCTTNILVSGEVTLGKHGKTVTYDALLAAVYGAANRLQHVHPALTARISVVEDGSAGKKPSYVLEHHEHDATPLAVVVRHAHDDAFDALVKSVSQVEMSADIPVARVHVLLPFSHSPPAAADAVDRAVVLLTIPHFISDGRNALEMYKRFLEYAFAGKQVATTEQQQQISLGGVAMYPREPLPWLDSMKMSLWFVSRIAWATTRSPITLPMKPLTATKDAAARLPSSSSSSSSSKTAIKTAAKPPLRLPGNLIVSDSHYETVILSEDETAALIVASKKHGATVLALLSLAASKAVATIVKAPIGSPVIGAFPMDTRPFLGIRDDVVGSFFGTGMIFYNIHESDAKTLAEITTDIRKQTTYSGRFFLRSHLKDVPAPPPPSGSPLPPPPLPMAFGISNLGKYEPFDLGDASVDKHLVHAITVGKRMTFGVTATKEALVKDVFDEFMTQLQHQLREIPLDVRPREPPACCS